MEEPGASAHEAPDAASLPPRVEPPLPHQAPDAASHPPLVEPPLPAPAHPPPTLDPKEETSDEDKFYLRHDQSTKITERDILMTYIHRYMEYLW